MRIVDLLNRLSNRDYITIELYVKVHVLAEPANVKFREWLCSKDSLANFDDSDRWLLSEDRQHHNF